MSGKKNKEYRRITDGGKLTYYRNAISALDQRNQQMQQTIMIISAGLNRLGNKIFMTRVEIESRQFDINQFERQNLVNALIYYEEALSILTGSLPGSTQFETIVAQCHQATEDAKAKLQKAGMCADNHPL